jgi:TonB family protein
MQFNIDKHLYAVSFSLALHALVFALASYNQFRFVGKLDKPMAKVQIIYAAVLSPAMEKEFPELAQRAPVRERTPSKVPVAKRKSPGLTQRVPVNEHTFPNSPAIHVESANAADVAPVGPVSPPVSDRQLAFQAAPPAPTAQEWAFAAKYTLKNSKGYRYTWGQQVRSMMGTAVEGPDQGVVRFRVEIAPDGTLARLETLWTTSTVAEQLARKTIENMQPLPPTPTGQPLIFERTISFSPFASDGPPIYQDDCIADPPIFRNPFVWDGRSPQVHADYKQAEKLDPRAMEECLRSLPQDSIEAESARDQRLLDQWGSSKSGH